MSTQRASRKYTADFLPLQFNTEYQLREMCARAGVHFSGIFKPSADCPGLLQFTTPKGYSLCVPLLDASPETIAARIERWRADHNVKGVA